MRKGMNVVMIFGLLSLGVASTAASAQVRARQENQQDRIAQGVGNGSLTPGETANLETKEARLNKEVRTDRKANGGNLTNKEKRQINRQQNKLSRQICRDKHN